MAETKQDEPMTPTEIRELEEEAYRASLESQAARIYTEQVYDDTEAAWQEVGRMTNEKLRQFIVNHGEEPEVDES